MHETSYPRLYLYRRIVQSKLFIDRNYAEPIDVGCISNQACFSKFHFIRTFKSIYGKTPHQYLSHVRIERAKYLLEKGESVTQVCFAVGFDSVSSFTGLFKKMAGQTPMSYQVQQQNRKQAIEEEPLRFVPSCFAEGNASDQKSNFQEAES